MARIKGLQEGLIGEVGTLVAKHGFTPHLSEQEYRKQEPFGWTSFHLFISRYGQVCFKVAAEVAIRIDAVQELVFEADDRLTKRQKAQTATISMGLGYLSEGRWKDWVVESEQDIAPTARALCDSFGSVGLPYLERYSDLGILYDYLSSGPAIWTEDRFHYTLLIKAIALAHVLGRYDDFGNLVESARKYLKGRNENANHLEEFEAFASRMLRKTAGSEEPISVVLEMSRTTEP